MTEPRALSPVVVGVDGSEASKDALRWAARHAELTGASLQLVTVWGRHPRDVAGHRSDADLDEEAGKFLQALIDDVLGPSPRVSVTPQVVKGHPALVLVEASRHAALLVLGKHGHGRLATATKAVASATLPAGPLLLGTVSQHCVDHAACPVLVVPSSPAVSIRTPPLATGR